MKKNYIILYLLVFTTIFGQNNYTINKDNSLTEKPSLTNINPKNQIYTDTELPLLIPKKNLQKFGYISRNKKIVIPYEYDLATFFAEDCNLLGSSNFNARKFGTKEYATVEKNQIAYRINTKGQKVYKYKNSDLGKCSGSFTKPLFYVYKKDGYYGILREGSLDEESSKKIKIEAKYDYLFILEGNDPSNPMIVACKNDKFGILDVNGNIIIPFEYNDIKRNYSWKLGKMFEVTKDDIDFYYIDIYNNSY